MTYKFKAKKNDFFVSFDLASTNVSIAFLQLVHSSNSQFKKKKIIIIRIKTIFNKILNTIDFWM